MIIQRNTKIPKRIVTRVTKGLPKLEAIKEYKQRHVTNLLT